MAVISASIAVVSQTVRFEPVQKDLFSAGTTGRRSVRLVDAGSGYNTQNDVPVHFALTDGAATLELRVRRPGQAVVARSISLNRSTFGGK